jgi:ankyrin repeat protein
MPLLDEMASTDFPATTDAPATASATRPVVAPTAAPTAAPTVEPKETNNIDGEAKLAPTDTPAAASAMTPVQPKNPFEPYDVFDASRTNNVVSLGRLLSFLGVEAVFKANNKGRTGLLFAAHYGHLTIVELLFGSGAEIDMTNDYCRETRPPMVTWM